MNNEIIDTKKEEKKHGGLIGGAVGAAAGLLTTVMSNPIGKWYIFQKQDKAGLDVFHFFEGITHNRAVADFAYNAFSTITNTVMAYPAILSIAGGVLSAGIGALIGKKISKGKL
jgi:hypothetical protein